MKKQTPHKHMAKAKSDSARSAGKPSPSCSSKPADKSKDAASRSAGKPGSKAKARKNASSAAGQIGKPSPARSSKPQTSKRPRHSMPQRGKLVDAGPLNACPVANRCGACQHVNRPYEEQLAAKDAAMRELFADLMASSASAGQTLLLSILGMSDPAHYRNKVTSPFVPGPKLPGNKGSSAKRDVLVGMYAAGTHRVVRTDECVVENQRARQVIQAIRALMLRYDIQPYDEDKGTGFMRHAVVRVGHRSNEVLLTLVTNQREFPSAKAFCRQLVQRCPFITTIVQNVNTRQTNVILGEQEQTLYGPGFILDELCGLSFRISSRSFYQVNAVQTEVLYRTAIDMAQLNGTEAVIDAYCGTGTIGLVAAKNGAGSVLGVDSVASAIKDARQNARHNGIENAEFVVADASDFMRDLASRGQRVDVVMMDPPRAGSTEEFLGALVQLAPARVVYISCGPQTQVRDIRFLTQRGYQLERVQPVDMFPHTNHVETVALLSKRER